MHWANFEIRGEDFPKRGSLFLRKNLIVSHVIDKELRLSRESCWPLRGQNWTEVVLAEQGVVHRTSLLFVLSLAKIWDLWKTGGLKIKKAIARLRWFEPAMRHPRKGSLFLVISLESGVKTYESAWSWDLSNSIKLLTSGRPSLKNWDSRLLMINLSWSQLLD